MPSRCKRMVTANKTFRFETDAQGEPLVHRVDGRHPESYYIEQPMVGMTSFEQVFDLNANIYLIDP